MSEEFTGPLHPHLLQRFADAFSRMELSLDLLEETLSILYMFHDPEGKYNLAVKIGELNLRYGLETREDAKGPARIYTAFYQSVIALVEDIEKEKKNERTAKKLSDLADALLVLHGREEDAKKLCVTWLVAVLKGMVKRFNVPMSSPRGMEEYIDRTFEPSTASLFNYAVALSGKLKGDDITKDDLVLAVSILITLTSKVNAIRKDALELINQGKIPDTGRNDPCPCGSGMKYKNCCMKIQ